MRSLSIKSARLSPSGKAKFDQFANSARMMLEAMLENAAEEIKETAARFAPSPEEETYLICIPGNDYDFIKHEAGFMYLQEAIITETIPIETKDGIITAHFGNVAELSPLIGFGWYAGYKKFEPVELRTTNDAAAGEYWKNLLEKWENGGSRFTLVARDPDDVLTIAKWGAELVVVDSVDKQIPDVQPFTMYKAAGYYSESMLNSRTRTVLRDLISTIFEKKY